MTFLPIVGRELRVRARSRASYWSRAAVGLVGVLIAVPPLVWSAPFGSQATIGRSAFAGTIGAAFLLCCAACLTTADAISRERREGTLGLLFLTKVRDFDIMAGKFAANGLSCLLALVAFAPVLVLPILAGGVTGGEVVRKALVLVAVLFVSLSAGLWASARGFERSRAARDALLLVGGLFLIPELVSLVLPRLHLALLSPLGTVELASQRGFAVAPAQYWLSLGLVSAIGCGLLGMAILMLRWRLRSGVEGGEAGLGDAGGRSSTSAATEPAASAPRQMQRCPYCGFKNEAQTTQCYGCGTRLWVEPIPPARPIVLSEQPTPLHWLLRRRRGLEPIVWLAAIIGFLHYAVFGAVGRFFPMGFFIYGASWGIGFVTTTLTGAFFAAAASRFFVEARRSGELELLLTTPVGAQRIVSAQIDVLKRLVIGPVALMLIPSLLQGFLAMGTGFFYRPADDWWRFYYLAGLAVGAVNLAVGVGAVCWLGLWFGWRTAQRGRTVAWTVALAKVPPFILSLIWGMLAAAFRYGPGYLLGSIAPQIATLLFYLWLIQVARQQLRREITGAEPLPLHQAFAQGIATSLNVIRRLRHWP